MSQITGLADFRLTSAEFLNLLQIAVLFSATENFRSTLTAEIVKVPYFLVHKTIDYRILILKSIFYHSISKFKSFRESHYLFGKEVRNKKEKLTLMFFTNLRYLWPDIGQGHYSFIFQHRLSDAPSFFILYISEY